MDIAMSGRRIRGIMLLLVCSFSVPPFSPSIPYTSPSPFLAKATPPSSGSNRRIPHLLRLAGQRPAQHRAYGRLQMVSVCRALERGVSGESGAGREGREGGGEDGAEGVVAGDAQAGAGYGRVRGSGEMGCGCEERWGGGGGGKGRVVGGGNGSRGRAWGR